MTYDHKTKDYFKSIANFWNLLHAPESKITNQTPIGLIHRSINLIFTTALTIDVIMMREVAQDAKQTGCGFGNDKISSCISNTRSIRAR